MTSCWGKLLNVCFGHASGVSVARKRNNLLNEYHQRLKDQYVDSISFSEFDVYEEAVKKFDRTFIVSLFRGCSQKIPENVFRKSLLALSHSPGAFWKLRNQFMRSYSTMCIYGWILGIGDRHLENTLVCLKTGNCIAIDFGYAFDTGVECTGVPELIPFRLTPHLKSIMAPMYLTGAQIKWNRWNDASVEKFEIWENGIKICSDPMICVREGKMKKLARFVVSLIRETMITTLRKIKDNEHILLAALQIFILEPALNWLNLARKRMQEQNENLEQDLHWYPTEKIRSIVCKLNGKNPAAILGEAIQNNQVINVNYKNACIKLVTSGRCLTDDKLIVADQVDQLLDLATDEGILGVSWYGLETYI